MISDPTFRQYVQAHSGCAIACAHVSRQGVEQEFANASSETRFELGSITKLFTAILLCKAADSGLCGFEDHVADYLPSPGAKFAGRLITLGQLATHTSGLPRLPLALYKDANSPQPYATWTRERTLRAFHQTSVLRSPGSQYGYSNFGFAVLGIALEEIFNRPYSELISELTADLGCPEIRLPLPTDLPSTPRGHNDKGQEADSWTFGAFAPAGGLTSNLDGAIKFTQRCLTPLEAPMLADSMVSRTRVRRPVPIRRAIPLFAGTLAGTSLLAAWQPATLYTPILAILAGSFYGGPAAGLVGSIGWAIGSTANHLPSESVGLHLGLGVCATGIGQSLARNRDIQEMGMGWHVSRTRGLAETEMLWHNGGTAGFRSFVGLRPSSGNASIVLSACSEAVDSVGVSLLR